MKRTVITVCALVGAVIFCANNIFAQTVANAGDKVTLTINYRTLEAEEYNYLTSHPAAKVFLEKGRYEKRAQAAPLSRSEEDKLQDKIEALRDSSIESNMSVKALNDSIAKMRAEAKAKSKYYFFVPTPFTRVATCTLTRPMEHTMIASNSTYRGMPVVVEDEGHVVYANCNLKHIAALNDIKNGKRFQPSISKVAVNNKDYEPLDVFGAEYKKDGSVVIKVMTSLY